jgi:hypothetical protein
VYLLVFHAYINEMHGSRSKIPSKKSRPYTYIKILALLGDPYIYIITYSMEQSPSWYIYIYLSRLMLNIGQYAMTCYVQYYFKFNLLNRFDNNVYRIHPYFLILILMLSNWCKLHSNVSRWFTVLCCKHIAIKQAATPILLHTVTL